MGVRPSAPPIWPRWTEPAFDPFRFFRLFGRTMEVVAGWNASLWISVSDTIWVVGREFIAPHGGYLGSPQRLPLATTQTFNPGGGPPESGGDVLL